MEKNERKTEETGKMEVKGVRGWKEESDGKIDGCLV